MVLLLWLLLLVGLLALSVVESKHAFRAAESARRELDIEDLGGPGPERQLRQVTAHAARARRAIRNPVTWPATVLPVVGRQIRSAGALAAAAEEVGRTGATGAQETRLLLEGAPTTASGRLETVTALHELIAGVRQDLSAIDLGPDRALVSPLAMRRDAVARDLVELEARLQTAEQVTRVVRDLLRGPNRYLLLAANNAEMRAGTGAFLSAAVLEASGGSFTLGPTRSTADLVLAGDGVRIEGDLAERWGFTGLNREWRNLGATPRFDVTAEVASRMWQAATGEEVDGVLAVDVGGLSAILAATGPIVLDDGRQLDAEGVEDFLLHDQYDVLASATRDDAQSARREQLGRIAELTTERLDTGEFDAPEFARSLLEAVEGRHLLAWAADPEDQRAWVEAGVAGRLRPDSLLVGLINRGGNKLDRFVRPEVALRSEPIAGGTAFTLDVSLRNAVGSREVPYVAGPAAGVEGRPGDYIGLVAVTVPGDSRSLRLDGGPTVAAGPDGPTRVIAGQVVIPRGETATLTVRFTRPLTSGTFHVEPSARMPSSRWTVGGRAFSDARGRSLAWTSSRAVSMS